MGGSNRAVGDIRDLHYLPTWFGGQSGDARGKSLRPLLQSAPVVAIADDHELWNNAPASQLHIQTTLKQAGRDHWIEAAKAWFDAFQLVPTGGAVSGVGRSRRIDSPPVSVYCCDTRWTRTTRRMLDNAGLAAVRNWVDFVNATPAIEVALFASGQSMLDRRVGDFKAHWVDAALANGEDYPLLVSELAACKKPFVWVTGDVHWGRAVRLAREPALGFQNAASGYEVITSPVALFERQGVVASRHQAPDLKPDVWDLVSASHKLFRGLEANPRVGLKGNQLALLSLRKLAGKWSAIVHMFAIGKGQPAEIVELPLFMAS